VGCTEDSNTHKKGDFPIPREIPLNFSASIDDKQNTHQKKERIWDHKKAF
jgi:hypothetical protein